MKRHIIIFVLLLLNSCSNSHYGMEKSEWDKLSEDEQNKIIESSQKIIGHSQRINRARDETAAAIQQAGTH